MSKNNHKTKKNEEQTINDRIFEYLKKNFDFGNGVNFSIRSHSGSDDKEGKTTIAFSSKLPKLIYKTNGIRREASVEFSSTEGENNALLHYLFKKTTH